MGKDTLVKSILVTALLAISSQSWAGSKTLIEQVIQSVDRTSIRSLHRLAQKIWPETYKRELPLWRDLQKSCADAPVLQVKAREIEKSLERDVNGPAIQFVHHKQGDRVIVKASPKLKKALLDKFDLRFQTIRELISRERKYAKNPIERFAINGVERTAVNLGNSVRQAIVVGDFQQCSARLHRILGS